MSKLIETLKSTHICELLPTLVNPLGSNTLNRPQQTTGVKLQLRVRGRASSKDGMKPESILNEERWRLKQSSVDFFTHKNKHFCQIYGYYISELVA